MAGGDADAAAARRPSYAEADARLIELLHEIKAVMEEEGRVATEAEIAMVREAFTARHEAHVRDVILRRRVTLAYEPNPEWPRAEWDELEARLRTPPAGWQHTRAALIEIEKHEQEQRLEAKLERGDLEARAQDEQAESRRGKWVRVILESEANKAAEIIYRNNSELSPYEVWLRYKRIQDREARIPGTNKPGWLSRRMVERLVDDLSGDEPLLIWDATAVREDDDELGRLLLPSGDLWANFGRGVLPRREPAS